MEILRRKTDGDPLKPGSSDSRKIKVRRINAKAIALIAILTAAGILHMAMAHSGLPYFPGTDEETIIYNALLSAQDGTFQPTCIGRPDHLEIRTLSIVYWLYASINDVSLTNLFFSFEANGYYSGFTSALSPEHAIIADFYYIGRIYTALWALIAAVLAYLLAERLERNTGLLAASLLAFGSVFIQNSVIIAPDIILGALALATCYALVRWIDERQIRWIALAGCLCGIAPLVKYPGVIFSLFALVIIIWTGWIKRRTVKPKQISSRNSALLPPALFCLCALGAAFLVSPWLVLHAGEALSGLTSEASRTPGVNALAIMPRPGSLDTLPFPINNVAYYLFVFLGYFGIISTVFVIIGICSLINHKNTSSVVLLLAPFYLVALSIASHAYWERWMVPSYALLSVVLAVGLKEASAFLIKKAQCKRPCTTLLRTTVLIALTIFVVNATLDSAASAKKFLMPTTNEASRTWILEHGIDPDEMVADGYSPKSIHLATLPSYLSLSEREGEIERMNSDTPPKFILISSVVSNRFSAHPDLYPEQIELYDRIKSSGQYELIYDVEGSGNTNIGRAEYKPFEIDNIAGNIRYLGSSILSGSTISIYQLADRT